VMQKKIREFLKEYNSKYKSTIILTSHYMDDVEELCKRVIIINYGKLLYDGDFGTLIKKHSPLKQITVILDQEINEEKIKEFGNLYKYEYPEWILRVRRSEVNKTAAEILEKFSVEDINIEDQGIDSVIRNFFIKSKK